VFAGSVIAFDGVDDGVVVPGLLPDTDGGMTLAFWFKADSAGSGSYGYLFSHAAYYWSGGLNVYLSSAGTLRTVLTGADEDYDYDALDVPGGFYDDSWHHFAVALTPAGGEVSASVYVDGVFEIQAIRGAGGVGWPGMQTFLGSRHDTYTTTHFPGAMSDIRVYSRELSVSDVAVLAAGAPE
jgi:hypothetical protein